MTHTVPQPLEKIDLRESASYIGAGSYTPKAVPLCIDMEGTLVLSNIVLEGAAALLGTKPELLLHIPFWLLKGRGNLKRQLAKQVSLNPALLPYNNDFVGWIASERKQDRPIWLITTADESTACRIAVHLGLFDGVLCMNSKTNLNGPAKLSQLRSHFGHNFDYAGNSAADLAVWSNCRNAIVVNASPKVTQLASAASRELRIFPRKTSGWKVFLGALRVQQWPKNLLIFIPLVTSHRIQDTRSLAMASLAAASFSFCASAVYVVNDLADLASDRQHATKRFRAFASGRLSLSTGFAMALSALAVAALLSLWLPPQFRLVLCAYLLLTFAYSVWLKRVVLIDVFILAALYTSRLVAGSAAYRIELSNWLLSFSMILFLSLGFCKRAAELRQLRHDSRHATPGRGYIAADFEHVSMFGIASGFLSSLVLPIYIQSEGVHTLYRNSSLLWLLFPVLLYWITRIWLMTSRGTMNEDPVRFAIRDPATWVIAATSAVVMFLAT